MGLLSSTQLELATLSPAFPFHAHSHTQRPLAPCAHPGTDATLAASTTSCLDRRGRHFLQVQSTLHTFQAHELAFVSRRLHRSVWPSTLGTADAEPGLAPFISNHLIEAFSVGEPPGTPGLA